MGNFFISYYFERLGLTCSFSKNWVGEQLNRVGSVTSEGGSVLGHSEKLFSGLT